MSRVPYFPFYPADFMNGVRGLTAQEVGVYTMLLCRIYEESGPVEYHPRRLSTYCGMREATFVSVVEKLVDLDKIQVADGRVSNRRAEVEIAKRADGLKIASKAGKASAEKRQQKQQQEATPVQQPFNHTDTDTDTEEEGGGSAREPISQSADPTFRERILEASGGDPVSGLTGHGGRRIGTQADMLEAGRWLAMGLTEAECLTEIAAVMAKKRDGPPSKLSYFTPAMQRLAGAKTAPTLSPTNSPAESRFAEPKPFRPDFSKYGVPK